MFCDISYFSNHTCSDISDTVISNHRHLSLRVFPIITRFRDRGGSWFIDNMVDHKGMRTEICSKR